MVDFRRMIPVLAVIAFLLGSAVTASAQTNPALTCLPNGGVPTPARAEGLTEQMGDMTVTCTGGTPAGPGAPILSTVNIQVFLNTGITSRLMAASSSGPQYSEALLLLDDPLPANQFPCTTATASTIAAVCTNIGNGVGGAVGGPAYYGAGAVGTAGNNKNVFQGIQTGTNVITFLGIPIDPPGSAGNQRIIRITNVRGNANALGVAGANAAPTVVIAQLTATPFGFFPVSSPTFSVGSVQRGLAFGLYTTAGGSTVFSTPPSMQQCVSRGSGVAAIAFLRYSELFATSFKRKNVISNDAAPTASGDQNNLTLGTYNTEAGFAGAVLAGLPAPTSSTGILLGQADYGTRLKAVFNNVPNGVSLFVDRIAGTPNGVLTPVGAVTDYAVMTASEAGAFSAVAATASSPPGTGALGTAQLTVTNNSATAVWEVLDSVATSFATFNFGVYATYTASPATNSPALATATVNGSYAPTSTVTTAVAGPIPRFADTSTANNLFSVVPCVTNLLFPYLTTQGGFDTGIAISATSTDPFGTSAQSGTCTLNWYGTAFTGATPTPVVNSGSTWVGVTSSILNNVQGGFTGYMIAVCRFQYAHGFAFVSDFGARNLAMGYLALIIPDPARTNGANPFTFLGGGGEQLGY